MADSSRIVYFKPIPTKKPEQSAFRPAPVFPFFPFLLLRSKPSDRNPRKEHQRVIISHPSEGKPTAQKSFSSKAFPWQNMTMSDPGIQGADSVLSLIHIFFPFI